MIEAPPSTVEKDLDFGIQDTAFLVLQQEMKGRGRDERRRQNEQKEERERERAKARNSKWGEFRLSPDQNPPIFSVDTPTFAALFKR